MNLTVEIPDDIAHRLAEAGGDRSRRALEGFAVEELKAGRITEAELCRMLGLARLQVDVFLKAHGVYEDYTLEDFKKVREALKEPWARATPVRRDVETIALAVMHGSSVRKSGERRPLR